MDSVTWSVVANPPDSFIHSFIHSLFLSFAFMSRALPRCRSPRTPSSLSAIHCSRPLSLETLPRYRVSVVLWALLRLFCEARHAYPLAVHARIAVQSQGVCAARHEWIGRMIRGNLPKHGLLPKCAVSGLKRSTEYGVHYWGWKTAQGSSGQRQNDVDVC